LEIARQLGKSGLLVLVGARNPALGEAAAERLRGEGVDARYLQVDLTEPATITAAAADIESREGRLDSVTAQGANKSAAPIKPSTFSSHARC
jgi:NAD(P)-dependent dehydrogenase (short-subunit alcohol dehydrogenase family)